MSYNLPNPRGQATVVVVALLLLAGAVGAQPGPYGYQQWYHHAWPTGPGMGGPYLYYYQQMPMPPPGGGYFGSLYGWGGNVVGSSSNLQDMGDYYVLQMRLPGVNPNDLNLRIDGRVLTITIHAAASQGAPGGGQWHNFFQDMQQTFTLPQPVDSARMQGRFENGILTMTAPKAGRMAPGQ